jgi:hypothetical protein
MLMESGPSVTVADAVVAELEFSTAFTVTVVWVGITAGAVYRPLVEIVPELGVTDQVTLVVFWPPNNAVNCCVLVANRF